MRVSIYDNFGVSQYQMSKVQYQMNQKQLEISSGRAFTDPSDDPMRQNRSFLISQAQGVSEQMQKNIGDASIFLNKTDAAFTSTIDMLQEVRKNGLLASNGTASTSDKNTYASSVEQSIQAILSLANGKELGGYVFSGEKTNTVPFTYDGTAVTYQGNSNVKSFEVTPNYSMPISEPGDVAFSDILTKLIALRDQIKTGTSATINTALSNLEDPTNALIDLRSKIGTRMKSLEVIGDNYKTMDASLTAQKGENEGIDLPKALSEFAIMQQIYEASIKSRTKIMQTSILNFI
jgi:flagellar hook-associated protein 3 FlgL